MPKRRRKATGTTQRDVSVRLDRATYNRLIKAADEFSAAIVAVAAVCVDRGPKRPRKRRQARPAPQKK